MTYHRPMNRHTMGQDWGGRPPANPPGCDKVTGSEIRQLAELLGIPVKREGGGWSMWLGFWDGAWWTLGTTNWIARESLYRQQKAQHASNDL